MRRCAVVNREPARLRDVLDGRLDVWSSTFTFKSLAVALPSNYPIWLSH